MHYSNIIKKSRKIDQNEYTESEGKGPYHNARMCIEIYNRISSLLSKKRD